MIKQKNNKKYHLTKYISRYIHIFDETAVSDYGKIRAYLQKNGTLIGAMDMLIAAHAKSEGLILVTNNTREFERVPELKLENWI